MTYTASCGHQTEAYHSVIEKGYDSRNEPCLFYKTVCTNCYLNGDYFADENLAFIWLSEETLALRNAECYNNDIN